LNEWIIATAVGTVVLSGALEFITMQAVSKYISAYLYIAIHIAPNAFYFPHHHTSLCYVMLYDAISSLLSSRLVCLRVKRLITGRAPSASTRSGCTPSAPPSSSTKWA
jgi:hypothetical protein